MAVSFRYGANGSYKSACAVWFDLLPNLRAGRVCITNVEGMQPLKVIEKRLGEKFPDSAQLIRISSRNLPGVKLWQNWFCWAPIGSFLLIDECQDLFGKHVGFKMEKQQLLPFEEFEPDLPAGFRELFESKWQPVDIENIDDGELDDTGRTQYDETGRLLYPFEFNGAFMRHRKYNWDIVMLTPDFKQIPSEVKGCAEVARQHKNTDMLFRKRKPRVYEHHPTVATTKPAKDDLIYYQKVPVAVHLLYSSTGTGKQTKSGQAVALFKQPKILIAFLIVFFCMGYLIYALSGFLTDDVASDSSVTEGGQVAEVSGAQSSSDVETSGDIDQSAPRSGGLGTGAGRNGDHKASDSGHFRLGGLASFFPYNGAEEVYVSSVLVSRRGETVDLDLLLKVVSRSGVFYLNKKHLELTGVSFVVLDECLVQIKKGDLVHFLTCPPVGNGFDQQLANNTKADERRIDKPQVSLF
ncbi:hypothetical protein BIT28_10735 [Photobacterium proteolyticum]|uniref:Zona occludens toxin N-terminal domain-containing protein n=1 Tax=Photobacterium proteolyticum TaxID=1903952 RepID=A0A1Q9G6U8_9GAMM|nr:zonular occludens toxin domain-containing protein [Photobacterium proteolyticum]OLQ70012.1 hypothetical protein BIT28_10735 [Photobacterium proteolyticum]